MRVLAALMLGASAAVGFSTPSWSQVYQIRTELDGIILDGGKDVDIATFPEDVVKEQSRQLRDYLDALLTRRFVTPPLLVRDLPTPYNTSVRGQAGYYRVTQTEPDIDLNLLR